MPQNVFVLAIDNKAVIFALPPAQKNALLPNFPAVGKVRVVPLAFGAPAGAELSVKIEDVLDKPVS